jgi:ferric-dicitrate binding protein FerR (iron transport regulator)
MSEQPRYHTHTRIRIDTPEQAIWWLAHWHNGHLIPQGADPKAPWRRTSPRELEAVAESLLKLRGQFDSRKFARDGETIA